MLISKQDQILGRTGLVAALLTAVLSLAVLSTAFASPDMGRSHGISMGRHCDKDMGHGKHVLHPHNAANHFLKMKSPLNLSDEQVKRLTAMRDDYITKNAAAEQQLKAANDDLRPLLYADDVDLDAVNAQLGKIGKLESQLWRAYAQQMHDIKALLTAEQKKALSSMWQKHHRMPCDKRPMKRKMP